jgi:hypothetical protein
MMNSREDPLVRSARREALIVLAVLAVAMAWTLGYCSQHAYNRTAGDIELILGFPDWIVWGVLAPWIGCSVVSIAFAFGVMSDDPLGEAVESWDPDAIEGGAAPREEPHA